MHSSFEEQEGSFLYKQFIDNKSDIVFVVTFITLICGFHLVIIHNI